MLRYPDPVVDGTFFKSIGVAIGAPNPVDWFHYGILHTLAPPALNHFARRGYSWLYEVMFPPSSNS